MLKNLKSHRKTKVMIHLTSAAVGGISYPSSEKMVMSKSILSKGEGGGRAHKFPYLHNPIFLLRSTSNSIAQHDVTTPPNPCTGQGIPLLEFIWNNQEKLCRTFLKTFNMDEISTHHTDKDRTKMATTTLMISITCVRCLERAIREEW